MFIKAFPATLVVFIAFVTGANGLGECSPSCETCHEFLSTYCFTCAKGYYDPSKFRSIYSCVKCPPECLTCYLPDENIFCHECIYGRYGRLCNLNCSDGCVHEKCGLLTGICTCKEHYAGDTCKDCVQGRYGKDCLKLCSDGCFNETCSRDNGECVCKSGFTGLNCTHCFSGKYGQSCQLDCSIGCLGGACDRQTGQCTCKENFVGEKCDQCADGRFDLQSNCSRVL